MEKAYDEKTVPKALRKYVDGGNPASTTKAMDDLDYELEQIARGDHELGTGVEVQRRKGEVKMEMRFVLALAKRRKENSEWIRDPAVAASSLEHAREIAQKRNVRALDHRVYLRVRNAREKVNENLNLAVSNT